MHALLICSFLLGLGETTEQQTVLIVIGAGFVLGRVTSATNSLDFSGAQVKAMLSTA